MTCSGCWRALMVGLAVLMVQGCATMRYERGSGVSLPGLDDIRALVAR